MILYILIAHSPEDLQNSLNTLTNFCAAWDLQVNIKKLRLSPLIVKYHLGIMSLHLMAYPPQHTSEYKYLGVLLTSKDSLKSAISTLALQADKAAFSLRRKVTLLHYHKPSTIIHIDKVLIRPITEYASEVWGYYKSDVLERGHRHFG